VVPAKKAVPGESVREESLMVSTGMAMYSGGALQRQAARGAGAREAIDRPTERRGARASVPPHEDTTPAGDFDAIVNAYQTPVYNLCARMLRDAQEAEDAAQETFLRAYRNLPRYDPDRRFSTWLLSIAAHHCIDRLRRRRLMPAGVEEWWEVPDLAPGPEAVYERSEQQNRVAQILRSLGALDRAAIVLRYWYDLSYEELAHALSLPVNTVKSRIHRAKRRMAAAWVEGGEKAGHGRPRSALAVGKTLSRPFGLPPQ